MTLVSTTNGAPVNWPGCRLALQDIWRVGTIGRQDNWQNRRGGKMAERVAFLIVDGIMSIRGNGFDGNTVYARQLIQVIEDIENPEFATYDLWTDHEWATAKRDRMNSYSMRNWMGIHYREELDKDVPGI